MIRLNIEAMSGNTPAWAASERVNVSPILSGRRGGDGQEARIEEDDPDRRGEGQLEARVEELEGIEEEDGERAEADRLEEMERPSRRAWPGGRRRP